MPVWARSQPRREPRGSDEDWERDYRATDVVAFLNSTAAVNHNTFWTGAADFVVEITSPGDRTYERIPFYSRLACGNSSSSTARRGRWNSTGTRPAAWRGSANRRRRRARSSPAASYRFASGCFPASPGRRSKSPTSKAPIAGWCKSGAPGQGKNFAFIASSPHQEAKGVSH